MKILAVLISSMLEFMKDEKTDMNMILYIKFNVNVIVKMSVVIYQYQSKISLYLKMAFQYKPSNF